MTNLCKKENAIKCFTKKKIIIFTTEQGKVIDSKEKNFFINAFEAKLQNEYKNMFSKVKIAEPLIDFAEKLNFFTAKELKEKKEDFTEFFIELSKTLKNQNKYYLIDYFVQKYYFDDYLLIPNIRFVEEYAFFHSIESFNIKLISYNTSVKDFSQDLISKVEPNDVINTTNFFLSSPNEQEAILTSIVKKQMSFENKKEKRRNPSIFNKSKTRKRIIKKTD